MGNFFVKKYLSKRTGLVLCRGGTLKICIRSGKFFIITYFTFFPPNLYMNEFSPQLMSFKFHPSLSMAIPRATKPWMIIYYRRLVCLILTIPHHNEYVVEMKIPDPRCISFPVTNHLTIHKHHHPPKQRRDGGL